MAVTVSRSGAMPQCCSMPDRISHNIQRGRQLAAALGGLWRSGSLANYYWLQFKSRSKKRGGSKRIKRIRAPSASFRGSTRCDQHGPLSCERAGLRLLLGLLGALAVRCGSRCCSPIRVYSLRRGCRSVAARRRRGFLEVQFGVLPPLKPMQWNPAHGRSPSCDIKELASAHRARRIRAYLTFGFGLHHTPPASL